MTWVWPESFYWTIVFQFGNLLMSAEPFDCLIVLVLHKLIIHGSNA